MRAFMVAIDEQRGHLFEWLPVLFAVGIGAYFALRVEPSVGALWVCGGVAAVCAALAVFAPPGPRLALVAAATLAAGFANAGYRAHDLGAPVLTFRYYGPVEGRIVSVDRSASDAVRITLDRVVLEDLSPARTPARVRVSLHGKQGFVDPVPGQIVGLTGHLSPPSGPVEPGGFDFQRQAWFQRLGGVGYTRTPVLEMAPPERDGFWLRISALRWALATRVQQELPGRIGAFAAAVTTGDRSAMDRQTVEALRASNLAHLLAISGLHMGLLTGFIFAAVRLLLIGVPYFGLRWPIKKIAAVVAMVAGVGYLLLSGGNVATERAFIMVTVMFLAVLFGRRAVTLRAVAVAALIVLALRPETLTGPGFQMSFAATIALVAVYAAMRERDWSQSRWPRPLRYVAGVALTSFVAGAATAPIAAVHFNQVPHFGLLANIAAVPVMGAVVIPGAVLAAVLAPLGLQGVGFALMAPAIAWILAVADTVAGWPGALSLVTAPSPWVLPLLAGAGAIIVVWQGRLRWVGLVPVVAAAVLWSVADRPDVLVSDTGGLIGVLGPEGRALSKPRGDGFSAMSWLENDGDAAVQEAAFARWSGGATDRIEEITIGGAKFLHARGKVAGARAVELCHSVDIVVMTSKAAPVSGCNIYDITRLRQTGSLAITIADDGLAIVEARARQGARLWSQ